MVAAMASLLLAGTILAPTQASATSQHSKSGPNSTTLMTIQTTILTLQNPEVLAVVLQTQQV
jgi:hypothetical protein